MRPLMAGWNALYFTPGAFKPDPNRSEEFNRGAYLAEGLGHCGACHTPFNAFGANKADKYLQGNQIDYWAAPNITNDMQSGLGKWSVDDIVAISQDRPNRHDARQRPDEGRDREFDLEDAGCGSQGDCGLSEGAGRGRFASAGRRLRLAMRG